MDPRELVLKYNKIQGVPVATIAEQIIGRRKAKEKIPVFYQANNIVYPPGTNIEQSSSETTALFKCSILSEELSEASILADLTGGLGVDSYFFSQIFNQVFYIETNAKLLEVAQHNHQQLNAKGVHYFNSSAEQFLSSSNQTFDCIFIDPSRRDKDNKKVASLADCEPNVISLVDKIFTKTKFILIKASPLLDIQQAINELSNIKKVFVVSVDNDCKEILFLCEKNFQDEPLIVAINLSRKKNTDALVFQFSEEREAKADFSDPLLYLFEPNSSILKAGAFKLVSKRFQLHKLHPNTHLYTSDKIVKGFPGKVFKIISEVKPDQKNVKKYFPQGKANVTTRNYPLSVKELKSKTGLMDGGDQFLIGFSGTKKKFLIAATKIESDVL